MGVTSDMCIESDRRNRFEINVPELLRNWDSLLNPQVIIINLNFSDIESDQITFTLYHLVKGAKLPI